MKEFVSIVSAYYLAALKSFNDIYLINDKKTIITSESHNTIAYRNSKKGLKLFNIKGMDIWSLNEKNAIKKFNKLKR